jgi:hypothetical protein
MEWLVIALSAGCNPKMVLTTDRSVTGYASAMIGPAGAWTHPLAD